jgi:hypothetical protein
MKIKELLTDESKWCKGMFASDVADYEVAPESAAAVKWCLLGAIYKCYGRKKKTKHGTMLMFGSRAKKVKFKLLNEEIGTGGDWIESWNDNPKRKFKALVERLDV